MAHTFELGTSVASPEDIGLTQTYLDLFQPKGLAKFWFRYSFLQLLNRKVCYNKKLLVSSFTEYDKNISLKDTWQQQVKQEKLKCL